MIHATSLLAAYLLDLRFGEPPAAIHPVVWMGRAVARGKRWALGGSKLSELLRGSLLAFGLPTLAATLAYGIVRAASDSNLLLLLVMTSVAQPMFAVRALRDAAFHMRDCLVQGDIEGARGGLLSLCSRDPSELGEEELVAATVESVAENASDSIIAPLFYFALFGLPGIVFYRASNTLDAMLGYRGRLEWAGKAAARLDDLLNLIPARLTAVALLLAGALRGCPARRALRVLRRDRYRTESPNAGHPMAAMAGLLGVSLEKPGAYRLGEPLDERETLRPLTVGHIDQAWSIVSLATLLTLFIDLAVVGLLHA